MAEGPAVVIVPVKGCARGKSRLASVLSSRERSRMVLWMLERVMQAARQAGFPAWVVGGDEPVARFCQRPGMRWLHDAGGLNPSVRAALHQGTTSGYPAALVVAADLPLVQPDDLWELARAVATPGTVALVPSPDGGTNAMAQSLPPAVEPSFGPGSYRRHRALAENAGLRVVTLELSRLAWDVDTPEDLVRLGQRGLVPAPLPRAREAAEEGRSPTGADPE